MFPSSPIKSSRENMSSKLLSNRATLQRHITSVQLSLFNSRAGLNRLKSFMGFIATIWVELLR